jgi:hypothetical protein
MSTAVWYVSRGPPKCDAHFCYSHGLNTFNFHSEIYDGIDLTIIHFSHLWIDFFFLFTEILGQMVAWFRYCAASWKVVGSIPDEVMGFFNSPNPSSLTMALGVTQPLIEMSTSLASVNKLSRKCGSIDVTTLWVSLACYRDSFTLHKYYVIL